jgi:tetratricopeptide (TPR) repeat protein
MFLAALLFTTIVHAQIEVGEYSNTKYSLIKTYSPPPLQIDRYQLVKKLNKNIKKVTTMAGNIGAWKGLTALDDRFSMQAGTMFFYSDIVADEKIKVYKNNQDNDWGVSVPVSKICGKPDHSVSFHFTSYENAQDFAENIFHIQQPFRAEQLKIKQHNDSLIRTDSIQFCILVVKYRKMEIKPTVTEEQRKYIVQANSFAKDQQYAEAIDAYKKAIAIDPVAYPQAYYNMALLYAEKKDFEMAVKNMKKYLLLLPDAPDARAAQDKIYEWER